MFPFRILFLGCTMDSIFCSTFYENDHLYNNNCYILYKLTYLHIRHTKHTSTLLTHTRIIFWHYVCISLKFIIVTVVNFIVVIGTSIICVYCICNVIVVVFYVVWILNQSNKYPVLCVCARVIMRIIIFLSNYSI